jgi:hypothetical protein
VKLFCPGQGPADFIEILRGIASSDSPESNRAGDIVSVVMSVGNNDCEV